MTNETIQKAVEEFAGWKRLLNEYRHDQRPTSEGNMAELWLIETLTTLYNDAVREERERIISDYGHYYDKFNSRLENELENEHTQPITNNPKNV